MKSSILSLVIIGVASASKPQLSVQVRDGSFAGIEGLDPVITWESSAESGDIDLEFGAEVAARPTSDVSSLPRSIWGKASKSFGGWATTARADIDPQNMETADFEIETGNEEGDLSIKVSGSAGKSFAVSNVEVTKTIESGDATVTVNPRYNLETEEGDVVIGYTADKTSVEVTASRDAQSVTVSQQLDDDNRIAPTLASGGAISVEWERSLGDDKSVTTTLKPNESVDVEWKDDAWTANINMPVDGTTIGDTSVSIKREVNF
jgi:hypothetical protein